MPVSKEQASFLAADGEEPADEAEVRAAQQIAGELLWVSQRTRPDIAFVCSLIGSLATRAPRRAVEVGEKTLALLQRTIDRQLIYEGRTPYLTGFVDASFAPDANRSHTGWLVQLAGNVIAWRSSRQSCISLSTAEAELEAAVEGLVAIQGIQAVLQDIGAESFQMQMHSDSTSALAIAQGSCSWRTRHLRLKSAWIGELISKNLVELNHCSGEVQPADMLTKPLSSGKIRSLSGLIGLIDETQLLPDRDPGRDGVQDVSSSSRSGSSIHTTHPNPIPKVLIALLILSQAGIGEAVRDDQAVVVYGSGVSVDYGLLTWMFLWFLVLLGLIGWELVKWAAWTIYDRASPGAKMRRLRRFQKLRDATTEAIQREIVERTGNRAEQRGRDSLRAPSTQKPDPPRGQLIDSSGSDAHKEERMQLLRKLAKGVKDTSDQSVQTAAFSPVQSPGVRVILRYVHEPPGEAFIVPGNECYHVYGDCHAFRHRGTGSRVENRRLCQYCYARAADDPDKSADYGRDLERAQEYERVFNTTLLTSGQSSGVNRT